MDRIALAPWQTRVIQWLANRRSRPRRVRAKEICLRRSATDLSTDEFFLAYTTVRVGDDEMLCIDVEGEFDPQSRRYEQSMRLVCGPAVILANAGGSPVGKLWLWPYPESGKTLGSLFDNGWRIVKRPRKDRRDFLPLT